MRQLNTAHTTPPRPVCLALALAVSHAERRVRELTVDEHAIVHGFAAQKQLHTRHRRQTQGCMPRIPRAGRTQRRAPLCFPAPGTPSRRHAQTHQPLLQRAAAPLRDDRQSGDLSSTQHTAWHCRAHMRTRTHTLGRQELEARLYAGGTREQHSSRPTNGS